jgi:hypothetical protein
MGERMDGEPTGTDLVVVALRTVRANEGTAVAMDVAEQIITSAAAILAHEIGLEGAMKVLEGVALALHDLRKAVH